MVECKIVSDVAELVSAQELADFLRVPLDTVYRWNYARTGPPYIRVGRHVRYRRADVDAWLEKNTQRSGAPTG